MNILITEAEDFSEEAVDLLQNAGHHVQKCRCADDAQSMLNANVEGVIVRFGISWDEPVLAKLPALKFIACPATGTDHIDAGFAATSGIRILSLAGHPGLKEITSTAEMAFGLLLALCRNIPAANADVLNGNWNRNAYRGSELKDKTLGVIGLGRLGRIVAGMAKAFRMDVVYYDPCVDDSFFERVSSLGELAERADVVSVHAILNKETSGLIDSTFFARSKSGQLFVNTARGNIVDEEALLNALHSGRLGGAAVDVLANEPATGEETHSPLIEYARDHGNVIVTPHLGGCTLEAMHATEVMLCRDIVNLFNQKEL